MDELIQQYILEHPGLLKGFPGQYDLGYTYPASSQQLENYYNNSVALPFTQSTTQSKGVINGQIDMPDQIVPPEAAENPALKFDTSKKSGFSDFVNSKTVQNVARAAGPVVGNLISGGYDAGGVGNAMQGLGQIAAAIPGPWGAAASAALNIGGGLVNRAFGSKMNKEGIAKSNAKIGAANSFNSNASTFEGLLSNMSTAPSINFNKSDIGKDGWFSNKASKKFNKVKLQAAEANRHVFNEFLTNRDNITKNTMNNLEANYAAFGGNLYANGGDFSNNVRIVNNGGTHEQNPYQGVPMGVDQQGVPNVVEEGEVIWNDYVFSNRIKVPKDTSKELGLGSKKKGYSFAEAAEKIQRESEERPNDPISRDTLNANLQYLKQAQEYERLKDQKNAQLQQAKLLLEQGVPMEQVEQAMQGIQPGDPYLQQENTGIPQEAFEQQMPEQMSSEEAAAAELNNMYALGGLMYNPYYENLYYDMPVVRKHDGVVKNEGVPIWKTPRKEYDPRWTAFIENNFTNDWYSKLDQGFWTGYNGNKPKDYNEARGWLLDKKGGKFTNFIASKMQANPDETAYIWKNNAGTTSTPPIVANSYTYNPSINRELFTNNGITLPDTIESPLNNKIFYISRPTDPNKPLEGITYSNFKNLFPNGITRTIDGRNYTILPEDVGENKTWQIDPNNPRLLINKNTKEVLFDTPGNNEISEYINNLPFDQRFSNLGEIANSMQKSVASGDMTQDIYNQLAAELGLGKVDDTLLSMLQKTYGVDLDVTRPQENYLTYARYAPALGALLGVTNDLLGHSNVPDYSFADLLLNSANGLSDVRWSPIGNYLTYNPLDPNIVFNKLSATKNATDRSIVNGSLGNSTIANAQQLANAANFYNSQGDALYNADVQNFNRRKDVSTFNRETDLSNSQGDLQAQTTNANNDRYQLAGIEKAVELMQNENNTASAGRSANLSNLFTSIGDIGWEEFNRQMVNTNKAEYYTIRRDGTVEYKDAFWNLSPQEQHRLLAELDSGKFYTSKSVRDFVNMRYAAINNSYS